MAEIIEFDFKEKKKVVEKYTITKTLCVVCYKTVLFDSRKENNDPYIALAEYRGKCVCKRCAVNIAEVVNENDWNK